MEEIEYLDEYKDFILPKTLNYSEQFSSDAIATDLLETPCNDTKSALIPDVTNHNNVSQCYPTSHSNKRKPNLVQIINSEVLRAPAQFSNCEHMNTFSKNIKYLTPLTATTSLPITSELQQTAFNVPFHDRIAHNTVLQRDKYKSVATVKPTLQRTINPIKRCVENRGSSLMKEFQLSSIIPPFASTETKSQTASIIKYAPKLDIIVSKENNAFLDFEVEKHRVDEFDLEFDLNTAKISDICSDSMNFSDEYNDDIFYLESCWSSESIAKKKLKRKTVKELEADRKKNRRATSLCLSKQLHQTGKPTTQNVQTKKSSFNQKHLENTIKHFDRKKSPTFEKKKINSNEKKSKLVIKKNGKKFVFLDRSKFSLKNLSGSKKFKDEKPGSFRRIELANVSQIERNNLLEKNNTPVQNYFCSVSKTTKIPKQKQEQMKTFSNSEAVQHSNESANINTTMSSLKEKEKVIFSSPRNMKRMSQMFDSEPLIHQKVTTHPKSMGLIFGSFSLKSIKPPSNLKKETLPTNLISWHAKTEINISPQAAKNVVITDEMKTKSKVSETFVELEKSSNIPKTIGSSQKCNRNDIINDKNEELVSKLKSNSELLKTQKKFSEHESSPVVQYQNNKNENESSKKVKDTDFSKQTFLENFSNENFLVKKTGSNENESLKTQTVPDKGESFKTRENVFDILPPKDNSFIECSDRETANDKKTKVSVDFFCEEEFTDKELASNKSEFVQTEKLLHCNNSKNDNFLEKTVTKLTNKNTNFVKKINDTKCSEQKRLEKFCENKFSSKACVTNKGDLLQTAQAVVNSSTTQNMNFGGQKNYRTLNNENGNKIITEVNDTHCSLKKSVENFSMDKKSVKASIPNRTPKDKMIDIKKPSMLEYKFEPRGFDIRLNKNIVTKLMDSRKTNSKQTFVSETEISNISCKSNITISQGNEASARKLSSGLAEGNKYKLPSNLPSDLLTSKVKDAIILKSLPNVPYLSKYDVSNPPTNNLEVNNEDLNKILSILPDECNNLALSVVSESQNSSLEQPKESYNKLKSTRQTTPALKKNNKFEQTEISSIIALSPETVNIKRPIIELTAPIASPTAIAPPTACTLDCLSKEKNINQSKTHSICDINIVETKKELDDETSVLQRRTTYLWTNDSYVNSGEKLKFSESSDASTKSCLDVNICINSMDSFGNGKLISKSTFFELPAYIVMKTKIITRKDLESTKTLIPSIVKNCADKEPEDIITESVVKTERPEFNTVCAQINTLLEQNANYLKFASASERLTRMSGVLADYSLSMEDAKCTFNFLKSYLSSGTRDKRIRTRGQQFIPIYDSQKKIIGYRKRTMQSKSKSSHGRISKQNSTPPLIVTKSNVSRSALISEINGEYSTKIEPDLIDVCDSETIVPDSSPANNLGLKTEEENAE